MPLKVEEVHQIIRLSDHFKLAFKRVNYSNFQDLENSIKNSVFSFDEYYSSITNLNRKFEWLSIRQLLIDLGDEEDIYYDEHGKPHFTKGNAHLSISHSIDSIAVSMHSNSPHGIDLQHLTPKIKRIKKKFLRDEEIQMMDQESVEELSVYWSMKEALFKLYGKKDIFLKGNIRLNDLRKKENKFSAHGEIINISNPISVEMEAILMEDYVLAYTLIP